ncbi:sugar diacid recognition domain-containing protein [Paenibacillus macerans]|uniref:CdaR family transcriptional regulator n=1 Tax=Paenibacillus macerans TaxID=44252 RepID=UPI002E1E65C7|nr:sugar diacid recognition domain-containing protein [Paenibacillus macerans]
MKITTELALPIVVQLMSVMEFNINIMDDQGVIVASGETERIGSLHEGALQVLGSRKQVLIGEAECLSLPGSKPGVNLPIEFQENIVGVVGITGNPDEVYRFGKIIKMNVEALLQQIHMNKQLHFRKMVLESFIMELISPYEFSEKKLRMTARTLQIDVNAERSVMVVEIEEMKWPEETISGEMLQKTGERKERFLNDLKAMVSMQALYAYVEDGAFFIAIPASDFLQPLVGKIEACLRRRGYRYCIGVGRPRSGLAGYKQSYGEARRCIRLSRKFGQPPQSASFIDDWGIVPYLEMVPPEARTEFLQKYGLFPQTLNEEYKLTLRTFLDCDLNVKQTASLLHVHRNTLFYRLDKISQLLQLDYRKFNDLVKMKLLLTFERLQE